MNIKEGIDIRVANNKMIATLTLHKNENIEEQKHITRDDIVSALQQERIVFGVDEKNINDLLTNLDYEEEVVIARGIEPELGKDGFLEYHFDILEKKLSPKMLENGTVDFKDLGLLKNVTKGTVIATIVPPKDGKVGRNVYGEEIKSKPSKPAVVKRGKNVVINEEQGVLISEVDGQVVVVDGKIEVHTTYNISGNVDHSTGNINFLGNVVVKGNVMNGFEIKAQGNVEIYGVVESAYIEAGGDILLHRGMQGMEKGILKAKGNIVAKYIENSIIQANNNITADAIMHSKVMCGSTLEIAGRKGLLVGGTIKVGKLIRAKTIGSHMATVTEIEVGIDPNVIIRYKQCKQELDEAEQELVKTDQIIDLLNKLKSAQKLTPEKHELLLKSIRTKFLLVNKKQQLSDELSTLEHKIENKNDGMIKVADVIHSGVKISIANAQMYVTEDLTRCTLFKEGAEVRIGAI